MASLLIAASLFTALAIYGCVPETNNQMPAIGLMLELTRHIGYENARLKAGELGLDMYKMREPLEKAGLRYID